MDNFNFDMICEGNDLLLMAMQIMFFDKHQARYPRRATHYRIDEKLGLIFYDYSFVISGDPKAAGMTKPEPDLIALPFKLDAVGAADFVTRWLAEAKYPSEPDHDGDNGKGWRVYSGSWGHPHSGNWSSFVAVQPAWAMYGK